MQVFAGDAEPLLYCLVNKSSGELKLYYGEQQENAVLAKTDGYYPLWGSEYGNSTITKVIIDASIADYPLTSTKRWFSEWSNLSDIDGLTYLNTSNVTDMESMFQGCSMLNSLDLSGFDTKNVTNMSYMFDDCSNLEVVYVGDNWNTASVTSSKDMFYGCEVLYGQNGTECLPGKLTAEYAHIDDGVSNPGYFTGVNQNAYKPAAPEGKQAYAVLDGTELTFRYDNNMPADAYPLKKFGSPWPTTLTKVIFHESFADYYPISCNGWFSRCSDLTEIVDMEKYLNTDEVLSMHWMFTDCCNLTNINLSHFNTEKVTDMCAMFVGCPASLDVSNFKTDNVTDMSDMFYACSGLTTLDVSNFNTANVTDMSGMFSGCSNLTTLDVSGFDTRNVINMGSMFSCKNLTELDVSNFNTSNVTDMSKMFDGCEKLTTLNLSSFNTSKVVDMSGMFMDCSNLTELDLSSFNTAIVQSMDHMFFVGGMGDNHTSGNLTTVYVSDNWSTESLLGDATMIFSDCKLVGGEGTSFEEQAQLATTEELRKRYRSKYFARIDGGEDAPGYFTYKASAQEDNREPYALLTDNGETVTFYYDANKSQHQDALGFDFSFTPGWTSAKVAIFDESFKEYKPTSCAWWFSNCSLLTEIRHLDYLNTEDVTEMQWMFMGCENLESIDVSKFNTSKVTNMPMMFYNCHKITELDLSSFDNSQFANSGLVMSCHNLTTIYVEDKWVNHRVGFYFSDCPKLIGGQGTLYNVNNRINDSDDSYARIDGGESAPGYFTRKGATKPEVKSIAITTLPKTAYVLGEELNTDNGELAVTIGNRNPQPHDFQGATVTGYDKTKEGKQTLTVEFLCATTTYDIEIASVAPTDTTLTAPAKLSYLEGEDLDLTDGKITIIYNNKTTESVVLTDAAITLSAFDNTLIGEQVISVLYNGVKVGEFTVSVVKPEPKPENPYTQPEVKENVYQISSAEELLYFMFDVNNGNVSANAVLLNDIVVNADLLKQIADLLKSTSKAAPVLTEWQPIGTAKNAYRGTFDGNGHTISGIYIKDETQNNVGLFGNVAPEAVIKNLGVTDSYIAGNENVGAICGKSEGTIVNCYTVSEVKGSKNVNHLVGAKETAAVVENCYYLAETPIANDPCAKTAEEFKSGDVAKLLAKGATINGVTYSGETFAGVTELPGTDIIPQPENNDNPSTPISSISENNIKVWSYNHTIYIENAPADTKYTIIDLNGRIITTSTTKSTREEINTNKSGIMILNIGNQSFKITQ